jgi:hypothetical protein
MKIDNQTKLEYHSTGYWDAILGRKISDADPFILAEAKRLVYGQLTVIKIPNNEITDIEENINSQNQLMTKHIRSEIEDIFATLLYHYETGYLTYKYEKEYDQNSMPEEINYSELARDIICQYAKNITHGTINLN